MLGEITYHNPTTLHFGAHALDALTCELTSYGQNVAFVYGGGSIKKNGIYDKVMDVLKKTGKQVTEISGVMPNPTLAKLREGITCAREHNVDFILAVGGGSVADYSKALSISIHLPADKDPWDTYFVQFEDVADDLEIVPVGVVLTMVGTGSEMNGGSVITNHDEHLKVGHTFGARVFPKFAIMNPEFTYTLPQYQMVSGIFDTMNHITEQYFSGTDDNTSDYLAEGLMRSLITASRIAVKDPQNYEARSNIMWTATWALNSLISQGKSTDWEVHMIGQAVGAVTNATHGMTLAAVALPYYRLIMPYGLPKFARFATAVWNISPEGKSEQELAAAGLDAMEAWMRELGCVMTIRELGATEENLTQIAGATFIQEGGYHKLSRDEIMQILHESLNV